MSKTLAGPGLVALGLLAVARGAPAGDESRDERPSPALEAVEASQVALVIVRGREESRFRATVLAIRDDELTILTAAHCLSPDDEGASVRIVRGEAGSGATVARVTRNPAYRPLGQAEIAGADDAVASLKLGPARGDDAGAIRGLKPAVLTGLPVPDPDGSSVSVLTIDQFNKHHIVKAGNFSNPRWLEWGSAYKPKEGDSGSGVFVFRRDRQGRPEPLLIGTVVVRSEIGGGAALVSARTRWLDEALKK